MGWIVVIGLAVLALALLIAGFKAPRRTWEALAAALVFGLAGFALQARTDLPSAPKAAIVAAPKGAEAMVSARRELFSADPLAGSNLLIMADGYTRKGQFRDAAALSLSAAEEQPGSAEPWLALGTNLLAHAGGVLTPAAEVAFRRAIAADPAHPAASYFLGVALTQNERFDDARKVWAALLERTPPGAPWRAGLVESLARLDQLIAGQGPPQPPR